MAEGGKGQTFASCMQNILAELGKAEAYPDADPNIIQGIREMVVPAVQQSIASQDPATQMAQMLGMGGGQPGAGPEGAPAPVETQQAMTRLPRHRGNPVEQAAAFERAAGGM